MKKRESEKKNKREREKIERHKERVREGEGRREAVSKSSHLIFFVSRGYRVVITPM